MQKTKPKVQLSELVEQACKLQKEIKQREKLLDLLKKEISPYFNPGDFMTAKDGTIEKSKEGKDSFVYLDKKEGEAEMKSFKEGMIKAGKAHIATGEPYLIIKVGKNID